MDQRGRAVSGVANVLSKADLRHQLSQQRVRVITIRSHLAWFRQRCKPQDITQFARQLATLLQAGIALLQSLEVIARSQPTSPLHSVALQIKSRVEAGHALHQALRDQAVFDDLFCHLVQVGEMTGGLDVLLQRVATHREKSEALRQALRSAMVYPLTVAIVASLVTALMLIWVVPAFAAVFESLGAALPYLTRCVMALSAALQQQGSMILLLLIATVVLCRVCLLRKGRWQHLWQSLLLRLPWVGRLVRHACLARWTRTLATLLGAGIALTEGLAAVASGVGNMHYAVATQQLHTQLMQGQSLTQALSQHPRLFEAMLVQMCDIGETSGTLDNMLDKTADHFETRVSQTLARLSVLVEPVMMVLLGLLIGTLVLALYLPLFELGQAL